MKGTSRRNLRFVAALAFVAGACDDPRSSVAARSSSLAMTSLYELWFDGATVSRGTVDVPPTVSRIAAGTTASFDVSVVAPRLSDAAARAAIARRVASYFLPYAFDEAPDAGAMTPKNVVLIGGQSAALEPTPDAIVAGLAPLDCGDAEPRNLGWVFAGELAPAFGGLLAVSATAAHELGHMLGLDHTRDVRDVMYTEDTPQQAVADLFALRFGAGPSSITGEVGLRCSNDATIDSHAHLLQRLGAGPDRGPAPTLAWTTPAAGFVPSTITITADPEGANLVEVWRNFELYAEVVPPVSLEVPLVGDVTFVTLDAWADSGTHTAETRRFERLDADLGVAVDAGPTDLRGVPGAADLTADFADFDAGESCACRTSARPTGSGALLIWSIYLTIRARRRGTRSG